MKKITAVLIGAGGRGVDSYAPYALNHPDEIQFVAVAEPDPLRRKRFLEAHKISADRTFAGYQELLSAPRLADAALICTQDRLHFEPTMRTIKLMGTKGEIRGDMEKNEIEVTTFLNQKVETIRLVPPSAGHGGGDTTILRDFVRAVQSGLTLEGQTSARVSVQSHLMAFAAEEARLEKKVIDLTAYRRTFERLSG